MRKKTTSKVPKASKPSKGQDNKAKKKSSPAPAAADTSVPAAAAAAKATPAARPTRKRTKKKSAVRYSPEQQAEIVQFVEEYKAKHGRAGQASASKKYGVSNLTISKWLKSSGKPAKKRGLGRPGRSGRSGRPGQPTPTTAASQPVSIAEGIGGTLQRMLQIQTEMEALRAEYSGLRDRL